MELNFLIGGPGGPEGLPTPMHGVQDDPVYAEHWAGHRPVEVTIEEDQIVIRRAGAGDDD